MSPTADQLDSSSDFTSILLKSPYGFGKTLAASTMCVDGDIFLAYWDKKKPVELENFYKNIIKRPELLKRIHYEVYGARNANEFHNKLVSMMNGQCNYIGVINDSITMMTSSAVGWSLGFRNPSGPKIDSMNKNAYQYIPDFDEYKVETSLVVQSLDMCKQLPCNIIWTAHPVPTMKIEENGPKMRITKVNQIVSYGSKVGSLVPGQFTEIYHLSLQNDWDAVRGIASQKRIVNTIGTGDDFAKTALNIPAEFDITNKLFWEEWKEVVRKGREQNESVT